MAEKILSVENLVINFKTDNGILKAVRNVSFDLERGETLCIVGESGSGKSVTSKAIIILKMLCTDYKRETNIYEEN